MRKALLIDFPVTQLYSEEPILSYIEYIIKEPDKDRGNAMKIKRISNNDEDSDGDKSDKL